MANLFFIPQAVRVDSSGQPYAGAKAYFYLTGTTTPTDTYEDSALGTPHANPVVADSEGQFAPIYLDPSVTYRCILKTTADVTLDDVDPVASPITASGVSITDSGAYFAEISTVEAALQNIGSLYLKTNRADTITADMTWSNADILMGDNIIERPEIKDYAITHTALTQTSGTVDCDLSTGNSFAFTLTDNATITLSNPPATGNYGKCRIRITQDGAGGAYTVAWPAGTVWGGGSAPTMSTGNGAVDIFYVETDDAGTVWYGSFLQANS